MKVVIVGGDNLGMINCNLCNNGFSVIKHISGRKSNHRCIKIPQNADVMLVFTDYVNHGLCEHIKKESKRLGVRLVFSKRAWSSVSALLCG